METFCILLLVSGFLAAVPNVNSGILDVEDKVLMYLYTANNSETPQTIFINGEPSLENSNFNSQIPTKFVIHGWMSDSNSEMNILIRTAYLDKNDFNVIVVDWSDLAFNEYTISSTFVPPVGEVVGKFIIYLVENWNATMNSINLIGHSLGAHVAGFSGKYVQEQNEKLPVIVGLDPAYPEWNLLPSNQRLSKNDADYVQTVHTNAYLYGFDKPLSHGAFYMNFGRYQRACDFHLEIYCSHEYAYKYFAESINTILEFKGDQCDSYLTILNLRYCHVSGPEGVMGGEPIRTDQFGFYNVITNNESPYAVG